MAKEMSETNDQQDVFFDVLKRTYERGMKDNELTIEKILNDLEMDLRKVTGR